VSAYRRAADVIGRMPKPVGELYASGGRKALEALPAIGPAIAAALAELIATGHS
jgi:DNA polymerase/3'-5' exonuclease PolX